MRICTSLSYAILYYIQVLATVCSREVGGRDFDDAIMEHIAAAFQKKHGMQWCIACSICIWGV